MVIKSMRMSRKSLPDFLLIRVSGVDAIAELSWDLSLHTENYNEKSHLRLATQNLHEGKGE